MTEFSFCETNPLAGKVTPLTNVFVFFLPDSKRDVAYLGRILEGFTLASQVTEIKTVIYCTRLQYIYYLIWCESSAVKLGSLVLFPDISSPWSAPWLSACTLLPSSGWFIHCQPHCCSGTAGFTWTPITGCTTAGSSQLRLHSETWHAGRNSSTG